MKAQTTHSRPLSRRHFLNGAGAAAVSALWTRRGYAKWKRRPNFLFLLSDDQRADSIAATGNPTVRTPHLDALVRRGVTFTNAYIMGSNQGAVCVPSRAMMLTGRYLHHLPNSSVLPPDIPLWPEILRNSGYATFGIGKWHNGPPSFNRCFGGGAKIFFGGMNDHFRMPVQDYDPAGKYGPERTYTETRFSSELFADEAIRFLDTYEQAEPFLLYAAFTAPHDPRTAPDPYAGMYAPEKMPVPPNFQPRHPFDNGELEVRDEKLAPWPRTPEIVQRHVADYYAMISHLDAQIGRILTALRNSVHADNTVVIFCGDNGLALGQHGLMGKQNLYEHSIHVPLIVAGPGAPENRKRPALCYLTDLFPTICEWAGAPVAAGIDGRSLGPVIAGRRKAHRDMLYFQYRGFQRAIRKHDWKLIEYTVGGERRVQLFELGRDPFETAGLSDSHPQLVDRLRREMHAFAR